MTADTANDYMTLAHEILPNGDLRVTVQNPDRSELDGYRFGADLLEALGLLGNGWGNINPADIGAMTDCDWIMTDDYSVLDDGTTEVYGRIWWFPNYMVVNPMRELAERGEVTFTFAAPARQ
jgi:hypothetical protein